MHDFEYNFRQMKIMCQMVPSVAKLVYQELKHVPGKFPRGNLGSKKKIILYAQFLVDAWFSQSIY